MSIKLTHPAQVEKTLPVDLTLTESGILCHVLMRAILDSGGLHKQPQYILALYEKLALVNDKLMGK
jgi:hypothetical protein